MNKIHRFISLILCAVFLFSFAFSPLRAYAVVDPAYTSAYVVVGDIVVEGIQEGSKVIASALASVWNKVFTAELLQTAQGVLEIGSFFTNSVAHKAVFDSYSEGELSAGQVVLTKAFLSSVAAAYKTKTGLTLSTPAEDVTIYVPPESVWTEAELITADRLNTKGFADLTEVNQNILAGNQITWQLKKDLNGLELYLRTTFLEELLSEFETLETVVNTVNTTLTSGFDSLETSVDSMRSTLSKDISDLKTLYSSFGQSTLDKLDTLNESIKAIDSSSNGADFTLLRDTIVEYDAFILGAIQDLPELISVSFETYFDEQSALLMEISDKLGYDSSYLEGLLNQSYLIRDVLSAGFDDLKVALDSLSVNISAEDLNFDFNPVVDQLLSSEMNIVSQLDSLFFLLKEDIVSLTTSIDTSTTSINETLTFVSSVLSEDIFNITDSIRGMIDSNAETLYQIQMLLTESWDQMFTEYNETLTFVSSVLSEDIFNITDSIREMTDSNAETLYQIQMLLTESWDQMFTEYTDLYNATVVGTLTDIKTAVQSIAGTTTADPGTGDDDSQDEADKQKIPLIPHINNGFQQGENYIGNVYTFLEDELEGFRVAALIFEEFAGISFFYKLIITSCSVGLIATLLGMALNVQSYSVASRRREEEVQRRVNAIMSDFTYGWY